MKTVVFRFGGEPAHDDLAVVAATTTLGGMSYATYKVVGEQVRAELVNGEAVKVIEPADSLAKIAAKLASAITDYKSEFLPEIFGARAADNMLIVTTTRDNISFIAQFQGAGTGTITEVT